MTTIDEQSVVPEFAHAVRGYDRYQVDDYIERLNEWAGGAEARALEAERTCREQAEEIRVLQERLEESEAQSAPAPDRALKLAMDRAADAVSEAVTQADEIRRRASADAEQRMGEASSQALWMVEAARQSVATLSEDAVAERRRAKERVEAILDSARRSAAEITQRAAEDAARAGDDASARAAGIIAEAEESAASVRRQAEADRRLVDEEVDRLKSEREDIMAELDRLRTAIHTLLSGIPVADGRAAAVGQDDAPATPVIEAAPVIEDAPVIDDAPAIEEAPPPEA